MAFPAIVQPFLITTSTLIATLGTATERLSHHTYLPVIYKKALALVVEQRNVLFFCLRDARDKVPNVCIKKSCKKIVPKRRSVSKRYCTRYK